MFGKQNTAGNNQVCQYFLKGQCKFGNQCYYSHSIPQGQFKNIKNYFW